MHKESVWQVSHYCLGNTFWKVQLDTVRASLFPGPERTSSVPYSAIDSNKVICFSTCSYECLVSISADMRHQHSCHSGHGQTTFLLYYYLRSQDHTPRSVPRNRAQNWSVPVRDIVRPYCGCYRGVSSMYSMVLVKE